MAMNPNKFYPNIVKMNKEIYFEERMLKNWSSCYSSIYLEFYSISLIIINIFKVNKQDEKL